MAKKKNSFTKAWVSLGKTTGKTANGKSVTFDFHILMSEEQAKLTGAKYSLKSPVPRTIVTKKGSYKREVSSNATAKYKLGYVVGVDKVKKQPIIKWVPLPIPQGLNLKETLQIVRRFFSKKPVYLKSPAGVRTRFITAK